MDETGSGDQTQQPKMKSQVQVVSVKKISWSKILITVLVIIVVTAVIAGAYWFFALNKPSDTSDLTGPVPKLKVTTATPSATSSTQKDDISDWRTYTDPKKDFSIKYPNSFSVEDITGTILGVGFNSPDKKLSSPPVVTLEKGGFITVYVKDVSSNNLDSEFTSYLQSTKTKSKTYTTLDENKAIKSTLVPYGSTYSNEPVIVFSVKSRQRFAIIMYAHQDSLQDVNEIFELMISTFKFLD